MRLRKQCRCGIKSQLFIFAALPLRRTKADGATMAATTINLEIITTKAK
jgi:hypothetical protein